MSIDVDATLAWMQRNKGLTLPFSLPAGSRPGGREKLDTQEAWDAYHWNPPQFVKDHIEEYRAADPHASPKPTWATLQEAYGQMMLVQTRSAISAALERELSRRISTAYGAAHKDEEILIRLRMRNPSADAERDRLYRRYRTHVTWLADAALDELAQFDVSADSLWTAGKPD